jgi:hypothetical membrane protein
MSSNDDGKGCRMETKIREHESLTKAISRPETPPHSQENLYQRIAGALLGFTGIAVILSVLTNEALYPAARHYSTFANSISDLSGTVPPHSYMVEPNRAIFIVTMAVAGMIVLAATTLLWRVFEHRGFLVALAVLGIGFLGIAVFPGNVVTWHPLFAMACFVGGSVAAILSVRILDRPLRYFAVVLGTVAVASTVLGLDALHNVWAETWIGLGGIERWIAYPVLLWMVLIGGALMTKGAGGQE